MGDIKSFGDLFVWQKSMKLAEQCYRLSKRFPREDQLVLGHELRKSCVSVPSNIAEGFGRHYTQEYIRHLRISKGSNNELQTQVELGQRVGIIAEEDAAAMIADAEEIGRMLHGLIGSLEHRIPPRSQYYRFASGFQCWSNVMGEAAASTTVLIRKRPSRATSYWRPPAPFAPPLTMCV